jgi:hypothetical protein
MQVVDGLGTILAVVHDQAVAILESQLLGHLRGWGAWLCEKKRRGGGRKKKRAGG